MKIKYFANYKNEGLLFRKRSIVYHDLFERVGRNESLMQSLFASRLDTTDGTALLAYDPAIVSNYPNQISEARYGFNEKSIAEKKKHQGYFALVSNCEKDSFECLWKYRRRENIEFFFEAGKQKTNGAQY